MVLFNPSLKSFFALNPNSFSAPLVSNILLGCPSGSLVYLVCLVHLVYLVCLVDLVSLVDLVA